MKIIKFLLSGVLLLGMSVSLKSQNIDLVLKDVTVKDAISVLSQRSGYSIIATTDVVNMSAIVSINAKQASIDDVINQILKGQNVSFKVEGKTVNISKVSGQKTSSSGKPLIMCKGVVVDKNGEPIIGAVVHSTESNSSAQTDLDGKFGIMARKGSILEFKILGYSDAEVQASENMNVVMNDSAEFLDEVVVIGYGSQKKKDLTGAITHVDVIKAQAEAPRSVGDLLRGKATGVQMWQSTDVSGHVNGVKVRGQNSIGSGNDAAIILDGALFHGFLSDINPSDIQSIDVLKDAASCAVYGANGAGGVILITTKKGEGGKPKINITSNVGIAQNSSRNVLLDGEGFLKYRKDMLTSKISESERPFKKEYYSDPRTLQQVSVLDWYNYTSIPKVSKIPEGTDLVATWLDRLGLQPREIECYENGIETNWADLIYPKAALQQDYQISVSNRNEKCSYMTSVGYTNKEGAQVGMGYKTVKGRVNIDSYLTKWLTVGTNAMLSIRDRSDVQVIDTRLMLSPYTTNDVDDLDSPYCFYPAGSGTPNPFLSHKYTEQDWKYILLNMNIYGQLNLPFGFQFKTTWSPTLNYMRQFYHRHSENITLTEKQIGSYKEHNEEFNWQLDNLLSWGKSFGEHRVEGTLLYTVEKNSSWNTCLEGYEFSPTDRLGYNNIYMATKQSGGSNSSFSSGLSYMGRVFYQYKGRYMFNASIRRDGWSAFGKNNKFGVFPALAVGWTFSEETFMKKVDWVNFGKLRLSYGVNGNRNVPNYAAIASITTGKYLEITPNGEAVTIATLYPGVANTSLQWESTKAYNLGLDLNLFDRRFELNYDLWNNISTDMLVKRKMLSTAGYGGSYDIIYANLGELRSHGMDISLTVYPVRKPNFNWDCSISLFTVRRKLAHLYGGLEDVLDEDGNVIGQKEPDDPTNNWYIGHDPDEIRAYEMDGVWQLGEEEEAAIYGCVPGDFRYVDQNEDGVLNEKDKIFTGKTYQIAPYTINFQNRFNIYKNLTFSFLIYAKFGLWGEFVQANNRSLSYNYYDQPVWSETNPIDDYARYGSYDFATQFRCRSFARVDNITLSYSIPERIIKKTLFTSCTISLSARNPFLFTKFPMGDPENYRNYSYGIRTFNLGLNFSL